METPSRWRGVRPWQRHGLVLLVAGLVYVGIGISYVLADPTGSRSAALYYALLIAPLPVWGVVWIVAGILSIISARWPPISETWGYTVLTAVAAGWAAFYAVGILFKQAPVTSISAVLSWGLVAFMWWAVSGLLNPTPKVVVVVPTHEEVLAVLKERDATTTIAVGED